jgi:hypothetical protein
MTQWTTADYADYLQRKARVAVADLLRAQTELLASRRDLGPDAAAKAEKAADDAAYHGLDADTPHGNLYRRERMLADIADVAAAKAERFSRR